MGDYGGDHLRQIFFHVFCGEPHDSIAACFEECLPLGVSFLLTAVNGAVDLHDEAIGGTEEIDHEGANRLLTAEMDAELVATQGGPQPPLTGRRPLAKVPCSLHHPKAQTRRNGYPLSFHRLPTQVSRSLPHV